MQLPDLAAFLAVATDRSFSAAARRLHRTQPAISQAVRRIEDELGERLFDRSSRDGTLTEAGRLLQDYAQRLLGLASEAQTAIQELQQVRRGRVIMGANEAAVHSLLPHIERFAVLHPQVAVEVRRVPSRQIAGAVLDRSIDFGVLTFLPADRGVQTVLLGGDDIVVLTEIARGHLAAVKVPELGAARQVRLAFRKTGERSRAAEAFLEVIKASGEDKLSGGVTKSRRSGGTEER